MNYKMKVKLYGWFYHSALKNSYKRCSNNNAISLKNIKDEYKRIMLRAKDIGNSKLLSAYCMSAYFIALNRTTGLSPTENYELFKNGLYISKIFHLAIGNADSYLDYKKLDSRKEWSRLSHERQYENDWVVDVLEGNGRYELGYNYYECGICKLCNDENCFELAQYLCQLDFVMADIMGLKLVRTQTIAEGAEYCDFRYSR